MRIVVGHTNPDFDAYASMVAAARLYPGAVAVFSGSQNANVRDFHNLHDEFLSFVDLKELDVTDVTSLVMVDTRDPDRLGELSGLARRDEIELIVYDHHPAQTGDVTGAEEHVRDVGATTSILVHELCDRGLSVSPLEASVMLLGIHEDTGSLTFPNTTAFDAQAVAWLLEQGGDLEVLNSYLQRTLDESQRALLAQLTESLQVWDVHGQDVAVGFAATDEYVDSAGVLSHYVVEDMGYRVAVAVVRMPGRTQVVARSRVAEVDVGAAMARLGGGGHAQAASARIADGSDEQIGVLLRSALEAEVNGPVRARDIMSRQVRSAGAEWTMRHAGELMATWGHGGLPVLGPDGELQGIVTRKSVDKAMRHDLGHAPVTGFMSRDLVLAAPDTPVDELERILATRGVGRLPVMEDGRMVGIVTRKDVLLAEHGTRYLTGVTSVAHSDGTRALRASVETLLPAEVAWALHLLGEVATATHVRAYLVGGFVRDMILGAPNLDIDVVVEGDGVAFAQAVATAAGVAVTTHERFGTAAIALSDGFHVDVTSARAEYYASPGALPTVERSSLKQDLFRRDFTINAMAACLDPGCFGAVTDPYAGLRDLSDGVVRVLHSMSFVDDPTRVLRAVRFETRYGFSMDASSESLARKAAEMRLLAEVSGSRVRDELFDILGEASPGVSLARLDELGAAATVLPRSADTRKLLTEIDIASSSLDALRRASSRVAPAMGEVLVVLAATSGSGPATTRRWLTHLHVGHAQGAAALQLAEHGARALRALSTSTAMRDSRLRRVLAPFSPAALAVLHVRATPEGRTRIERYVGELASIRAAVTGNDLIALGAEAGAGFSAILARALDDRVDGRAVGREAELANLARLARSAGLIP